MTGERNPSTDPDDTGCYFVLGFSPVGLGGGVGLGFWGFGP